MFDLNLKTGLWITTAVIASGALTIVASAQTAGNSPFASKRKTNAWETQAPTPPPAPQTQPSTALPLRGSNMTFEAPAPSYQPPQTFKQVPGYTVTPGSSSSEFIAPPSIPTQQPPQTLGQPQTPSYVTPTNIREQAVPDASVGAYYPGRSGGAPSVNSYESGSGQNPYGPMGYGQNTYGQNNPGPARPVQPQSWKHRLGFGNLVTSMRGFFKLGAAATERDGWDADFIADGMIAGEVSAITDGGLEYGLGAEVRGQYDKYRRGFGGLAGDCPANVPGCVSVDVNGTPTAYRGHTSQFYASGPSNAKEGEIALEGAYLFLRSSYGDVTVGRDDGAAYLFSLGAPTLMAVNGSNSSVDYTGLDSVKTVNDASGFSEKITYVSPRLLGDNIGVGVQFGASYAPNARACGVDYCVRENGDDGTGVISPDLKNVFEVGLSLDRTFDSGLKVEGTATYATASEDSNIAAFDNLQAYNFGFDVTYEDWRMGASYLDSNNGLVDGDYTAWDAGITWKPAAWGVSASIGQAVDDNIRLKSNQAVVGFSYEFEKFTLGTGVQYIERKAPVNNAGVITIDKEKATALFIEGGFKF